MPAMKTTGIFFVVAFASMTAMAERFAGFWTTVDDESKEKKSVVQVYVHEGKYYGRIVKLFKNQDAVAKLPGIVFGFSWGEKVVKEMKHKSRGIVQLMVAVLVTVLLCLIAVFGI